MKNPSTTKKYAPFIHELGKAITEAETLQVSDCMEWRRREVLKRLQQIQHIVFDIESAEAFIGTAPGWRDKQYEHITGKLSAEFTRLNKQDTNAPNNLQIKTGHVIHKVVASASCRAYIFEYK
jgi:3-mercaptopyruvate sulfurtransferase SseA